MESLTPAQRAVMERIQKKKELEQKKASKRKSKKAVSQERQADNSKTNDVAVAETTVVSAPETKSSRKRKIQEIESTFVDKTSIDTPKQKKQQTNTAIVEPPHSPPQEVVRPARGGRKKVQDDAQVDNSSNANTTMTPAQLDVLEKMKANEEKKAKESHKKTETKSKSASDTLEIDITEEPLSSTMIEAKTGRGRRKTLGADVSMISKPARRKTAAEKVIELSDQDDDESVATKEVEKPVEVPQPKSPVKRRPTRGKAAEVSQIEEDITQSPMNVSMMAVLKKIKEKKESQAKTKKKQTENEAENCPVEEKSPERAPIIVADLSDSDDVMIQTERLSISEIREVIERAKAPENSREKAFYKRLQKAGVISAFDEGLELTGEQNALVEKIRKLLKNFSPQKKRQSKNVTEIDDDTTEDEIVEITSRSSKEAEPVINDESMDVGTVQAARNKKTFLIFDTNAYIKILPHCRAVLDSDKIKDHQDFEELIMFALFVVIRELDFLSKKDKNHLKQPAMGAIKLIHCALQDNNRHIEGQDFASSQEKLASSTVNDDYILKSADLVKCRGDHVIVVTDDQNLQVKISMMRITSLNCLEFIHRYHWLTPLIVPNLRREIITVGENTFSRFTECVVASIVLKGIMAHLAPMPMEERRELFPTQKLATLLALTLKNKQTLESRTGPFAVISYDRVAQTLSPLKEYNDACRNNAPDRMKYFARFAKSAAILCQYIANYFPNMESRAEFIVAVADYFKKDLPEEEQYVAQDSVKRTRYERKTETTAARSADVTARREVEPAPRRNTEAAQRWNAEPAPARKTLLPTPNIPPLAVQSGYVAPSRQNLSFSSPRTNLAATRRPEVTAADNLVKTPIQEQPQQRTTRRTTRSAVQKDEESNPPESIYFSFSQGRKETTDTFKPIETPSSSQSITPFQMGTPKRPVAKRKENPTSPYSDCQDMISGDILQMVYEFFQKLGMSVCNYTGSCCVKLGVRFSMAFKVSGARLDESLHDVTEKFSLVLTAMKMIIIGTESIEPAREFLRQSVGLLETIRQVDPTLVCEAPTISAASILAFSKDNGGKQQLETGYQQFCDFKNCLEKCWLEAQRH